MNLPPPMQKFSPGAKKSLPRSSGRPWPAWPNAQRKTHNKREVSAVIYLIPTRVTDPDPDFYPLFVSLKILLVIKWSKGEINNSIGHVFLCVCAAQNYKLRTDTVPLQLTDGPTNLKELLENATFLIFNAFPVDLRLFRSIKFGLLDLDRLRCQKHRLLLLGGSFQFEVKCSNPLIPSDNFSKWSDSERKHFNTRHYRTNGLLLCCGCLWREVVSDPGPPPGPAGAPRSCTRRRPVA